MISLCGRAGTLCGDEPQMAAVGGGLMSNPRFLMLDEPSLGLAPPVVNGVLENGRIVLHGTGPVNLAIDQIQKGYLGL